MKFSPCIFATFMICLAVVNCNWTRCLHIPESNTVDCSGRHFFKISHTARLNAPRSEFYPNAIGGRVRVLNLSRNAFRSINFSSFSALRHPEALEILLLNDNQIHSLNRSSFAELKSLEKINLDSNPLSSFPDRTFSPLTKLRDISIMSKQLSCDCQIADLLRFVNRNKQMRVSNRTVCVFPRSLRGMQIAGLDAKVLKRSCGKGEFNPGVFEMEPASSSLIVYPGGKNNITCKVSNFENVYMEWLKNNVPVNDNSRIRITRYNDTHFL
ncbi:unnamed protein product [Gongylonema pulchrum]|uniref:Ig-like domain-containing protein n=1 Tax=Gongylonema pulchrum TaxID=637853 RepID=A0A183CUT4_9BILA|nr:unnamed protein product [Gongylonema pulchrum]